MDDIGKILAGKMETPGNPPLDDNDMLLVSERVLAGAAVLFLFRDAPGEGDSGWVLLAGTEPDEHLSDPSKFEGRSVAWALDSDPSLGPVLGAPPDSSFEREALTDDWAELEEE